MQIEKTNIHIEKEPTPVKNEIKIEVHGYGTGHFSRFEGKVLTIIEALGIGASQEKATKSLLREEIWKLWDEPSFCEVKKISYPNYIEMNSKEVE